ncbi:hypothetical protein IGI04_030865, partial [Brassica rapa subsp. trilocularis]
MSVPPPIALSRVGSGRVRSNLGRFLDCTTRSTPFVQTPILGKARGVPWERLYDIATFVDEYSDHDDPVTVIDEKRTYNVKAPARHPIYENFRVKTFKALLTSATSDEQLTALGGFLYQLQPVRTRIRRNKQAGPIQQRYKAATGYLPLIFEGSSPGAGKFGYLRIR